MPVNPKSGPELFAVLVELRIAEHRTDADEAGDRRR